MFYLGHPTLVRLPTHVSWESQVRKSGFDYQYNYSKMKKICEYYGFIKNVAGNF